MDWHKRFVQQAAWTKELRTYLFLHAGMASARRVLEVGCGTGAILSDLDTPAAIHGLDLDPARLRMAHVHAPHASLVCGDALSLPYAPASFEIIFCHFLLLWVSDPLRVLQEMKRLTCPGGSILALAEPDYNRRVDKPDELAVLGRWQTEALRRQGADPGLGGCLAELFHEAGIQLIETGSLRAGGGTPPSRDEQEMEWAVLETDLSGSIPKEEIQLLKHLDQRAWQRGERLRYVPTYFAWGRLPQMV